MNTNERDHFVIKDFKTADLLTHARVQILKTATGGMAINHPRKQMELPVLFSMSAQQPIYQAITELAGVDRREIARLNHRIEILIDMGDYGQMRESFSDRSCYGATGGWQEHYLEVIDTVGGELHLYAKYQRILGGWKLGVLDRAEFINGLAEKLKSAVKEG